MFDFLVFSLYVDHFGLYSGHSEHEVVEILYSTYFLWWVVLLLFYHAMSSGGLNIKLAFLRNSNSGLTSMFCLCLSSFHTSPHTLGSGVCRDVSRRNSGILTLAFALDSPTLVSSHGGHGLNFLDYLARKTVFYHSWVPPPLNAPRKQLDFISGWNPQKQ